MLLREFWNGRFWPYCTANLRESTCVGYESAWRLHVAPRFGAMQMESISVELVDKWLAGFASSGAARKAWAVLRAILRRAIRWNLLDVDITRRDIQLPAKPHYEPRILTIRQQRTLLQGFYGHPLEAWLICAASCGLRTEEGYGLVETSAERPNRVGRVIGFLPVWGLDVDVECAVIIRGDGMASAQNIRHSG